MASSRSPSAGLYFPSLITGLCAKAGIFWNDKVEEITQPKLAIDTRSILNIKGWKESGETGEVGSSRQPSSAAGPSSSQPAGMTISARLARLEQQFAAEATLNAERAVYHAECQQTMDQLLRTMAGYSGIDISHIPSLPPYPSHLRGASTSAEPEAFGESESDSEDED